MVHTRHGDGRRHRSPADRGRVHARARSRRRPTLTAFTPIPTLTAELSVTTYLTPADQGLTAGATPTGPAPATTTPASTPGSTATRLRPPAPTSTGRARRRRHEEDQIPRSSAELKPRIKLRVQPGILSNLYRDMRDRRLLLPALALVVALIAVPVALSSSSATTAPPPAPAAAGAAQRGRHRAGGADRAARGDRLPQAPRAAQEQEPVPQAVHQRCRRAPSSRHRRSPSATSSTATTITGAGSSSATPSATSTVPATGGSTTSTGSTTPSAPSSEPPSETPKPTTELIQRRIDVKVGPQGDLQKRSGVKQLEVPAHREHARGRLPRHERGRKHAPLPRLHRRHAQSAATVPA